MKIEQLRRDSERKEFEECIQIIRKSDSIDEAKAVSSKYLSKALDLISELPDGHPKSLLLSLTKKWGQETHSIYEKYCFTNLLIYNSNIHKPIKHRGYIKWNVHFND